MGTKKPDGFWQEWSNVEEEFARLTRELGHPPSASEMNRHNSGLIYAIRKYHGGLKAARERLDVEAKRRPEGYWKDEQNIESELADLAERLGHFPSTGEISRAGISGLMKVAGKAGNLDRIRRKLGFEEGSRPKNYWRRWKNAEAELSSLIEQLGHFPSYAEFERTGNSSLYSALAKYHGGLQTVRKRLGYEQSQHPKGHWKNPDNIVTEVQAVMDEHGYAEVPKEAQLIELGRRDLTNAIYRYYPGRLTALRRAIKGESQEPEGQLESVLESYTGGNEDG